MNLQLVLDLDLACLNRKTYDTLKRRTGLPFMDKAHTSTTKREKYLVGHALALECMREIQSQGIGAQKSCDAVSQGFFDILRFAKQGCFSSAESDPPAFLHLYQLEDGQQLASVGPIDDLSCYTTNRVKFCIQLNLEIVWEKVGSRFGRGDEAIKVWPYCRAQP